LRSRWEDLFKLKFEVLLYDLTSTYFESNPPFPEGDKRKFGHSRDKRSDCVQMVIGLVVTPEGFPLAYETMAGNTSDKTTLRDFLKRIEDLHGKADRIWVMDRGIPTEATLEEMRAHDPPISYLVGTPKGRLTRYEKDLVDQPWHQVREGVEVKLLPKSAELYVLAQSRDRVCKERAMRRRQLKGLWKRLKELQGKEIKRDALLIKLGAAKNLYPGAWRLVKIEVPEGSRKQVVKAWSFALLKDKLKQTRRREGRYLLRTNLTQENPAKLWEFYIQLTQVEAAFKDLKDDLSLRPIFHQLEKRIDAHVFVAFQAYCLHVSLREHLRAHAPGLTPRSVLEKFSAIQMLDVHFPTTDHRQLIFRRYTQPEKDHKMILAQLQWQLPPQHPPQITGKGKVAVDSLD
jgi:transposase